MKCPNCDVNLVMTERSGFEDDFRLRLRHFLSANVALNRKQMGDKILYL